MSADFDLSREETGFLFLETKLGFRGTSIFSLEFMLHLLPASSAETLHSCERYSSLKLKITVYKVLNMDIFLHKCIDLLQKAFIKLQL